VTFIDKAMSSDEESCIWQRNESNSGALGTFVVLGTTLLKSIMVTTRLSCSQARLQWLYWCQPCALLGERNIWTGVMKYCGERGPPASVDGRNRLDC